MEEQRKKLVVWSGGMDSTLLLHNLAKESSTKNPIKTFSFQPDFIEPNKLVKEQQVRKNYLEFARSLGFHINTNVIKIISDTYPTASWGQQKTWFSFILPYIPNNCDVYFGYVQGDCIWLAVSNFYKIFQEYQYIGSFQNSNLHFPFSFKEKWEILKEYQEEGIPKDCFWTCEKPKLGKNKKIQPCKKCHPCVSLEIAKRELEYRRKTNV